MRASSLLIISLCLAGCGTAPTTVGTQKQADLINDLVLWAQENCEETTVSCPTECGDLNVTVCQYELCEPLPGGGMTSEEFNQAIVDQQCNLQGCTYPYCSMGHIVACGGGVDDDCKADVDNQCTKTTSGGSCPSTAPSPNVINDTIQ